MTTPHNHASALELAKTIMASPANDPSDGRTIWISDRWATTIEAADINALAALAVAQAEELAELRARVAGHAAKGEVMSSLQAWAIVRDGRVVSVWETESEAICMHRLKQRDGAYSLIRMIPALAAPGGKAPVVPAEKDPADA